MDKVRALTRKIEELKQVISASQNQLNALTKQLEEERKKEDFKKLEIRVTDHVVIRYMERKFGVSLDDIRREILSPQLIQLCETLPYFKHNGFVVKNKTVITYCKDND